MKEPDAIDVEPMKKISNSLTLFLENESASFEELNATTEELVVMNDEMVEQARVNDENITQLLTEEKKLTSIVDKSMNAFEKLEYIGEDSHSK